MTAHLDTADRPSWWLPKQLLAVLRPIKARGAIDTRSILRWHLGVTRQVQFGQVAEVCMRYSTAWATGFTRRPWLFSSLTKP